jgi:hypothetical protein
MPLLDRFRQSRSALALLVTLLYALLAAVALYVPISPAAPFARMFGTPDLARDAVVSFVQFLSWPVGAFLLVTAAQEIASLVSAARSRRG